MVKSRGIRTEPAQPISKTHVDYATDFIKPCKPLSEEEILDISTPRQFTYNEPFDNDSDDQYAYFYDFVKRGRVPIDTPEERMCDEEYRSYAVMIETIIKNYQSEQPQEPLQPDDQVYIEAYIRSPFQQDLFAYFTNTACTEALTKAAKRECKRKLTFLDRQLLGIVKRRDRPRIVQFDEEGLSAEQIAHQFNLAYKAEEISGFLELHRKYRKKLTSLKGEAKGPKITPEIEALVIKIAGDPDLAQFTLAEIDSVIEKKTGVKIGSFAVSNILKDNGYAKKKPTFSVPESDCTAHKNARIKVVKTLVGFLLENRDIVSIDETQCQAGFTRTAVWGKKGMRCVLPAGRKGKPVHILAAVWKHGLLGYMVRDERIRSNGHIYFLDRLYEELKGIDPEHYKTRFVILMDNAGAHKKKDVKEFVEASGIPVVCNGPMTPHIQPIEYIFSMFKRELKRSNDSGRDRLRLLVGIYNAFYTVYKMKAEVYNTFQHTFKFYKPILRFENISSGSSQQMATNKVLKSYLQLMQKQSESVDPVDLTG